MNFGKVKYSVPLNVNYLRTSENEERFGAKDIYSKASKIGCAGKKD